MPHRKAPGGARPGAGRKHGSLLPGHKALRDLARDHVEEAIGVVLAVMRDPSHPKRLDAAQLMIERAWGRAPQNIEVTGADGGPIVVAEITLKPI